MTLAYDASDPTNQLIAQRIALNARDAGMRVQTSAAAGASDLRLVRIPLTSPQSQVALEAVAETAGLPSVQFQGNSPEELYAREREMLQSGRIIPLAHVPEAVTIAPGVNGWRTDLLGRYRLADLWLGVVAP